MRPRCAPINPFSWHTSAPVGEGFSLTHYNDKKGAPFAGAPFGIDKWEKASIYHLKSGIRHKRLGDANTFGGLVIFQQSSYDAGQGQCTTIEGVA